MSLYNGFVSKEQESKYYTLVHYLLQAVTKRLLKFYAGEPCNESKFLQILSKITRKIGKMEQNKYHEPKFAHLPVQLMQAVAPQFDFHRRSNLSQASSFLPDNKSGFSMDFSLEDDRRRPSRVASNGKESAILSTYPEKKHRSYELIRKGRGSEEGQGEEEREERGEGPGVQSQSRLLKSKINEFRSMRMRMHPPKLGDYLERIRKESKVVLREERSRGKLKTVDEMEPYISQRRKKTKKVFRSIGHER